MVLLAVPSSVSRGARKSVCEMDQSSVAFALGAGVVLLSVSAFIFPSASLLPALFPFCRLLTQFGLPCSAFHPRPEGEISLNFPVVAFSQLLTGFLL